MTGIAPDVTAPVRILASRTPAPGAVNQPLTGLVISININEANGIAPSTVNGNTFWVETTVGGLRVPVTYSPIVGGPPIWTVAMTPSVNLEYNTQYTVTLTTGVEDLSGNNLPAGTTWSFTTVPTPIDPVPGAPTITDGGPLVDGVTATTAEVHWTTSETTNYNRLRYGRGDTVPAFIADALTYLSFHAVTLNPPLLPGKRYWLQFQIGDFEDYTGIVNGIPYPAIIPLQFNTATAEVPVTVHAGAQRQSSISLVQQRIGVANTGIFSFWQESDIPATRIHLYGQLYDSTPAAQWNAGSPNPLYTTPATVFTYASAVEDELGGVIVLATVGGNIYAKRLDAAGNFVNWGASADQATDLGFSIAAGSSPSAVPVYTNILLRVDSGTETRGSEALPNRVYEHDLFGINTLFDLVADGDVIVDTANHTGTTIDVNSVAPDFGYIVGQDGVQAVAPGEAYVVGDGIANTTFDTASDHVMEVAGNLASGGNLVYTSHGFVLPAWLGAGDIISRWGGQLRTNCRGRRDALFDRVF